jgi:glycine C-acetyltransferase
MGGFTSGRKEIIEMLRQKSRPYLFSNSLAPSIVGSGIKVLEILEKSTDLRDKLEKNTKYFRESMSSAGFDIKEGIHAIVPVMLYDAKLAGLMADKLLQEGIYVIGFSFPVVPKGEARIRVQISAAHSIENLDHAINSFVKVAKELGVLDNN